MLNPNGVLIAHDVTNKNFPNLLGYVEEAKAQNLAHKIYNQSTRNDERCHRGMLVVYK